LFSHYGPWKGEMISRRRGALVAFETGESTAYGLHNIEDRGVLFVSPGEQVYAGMIIGENSREADLDVNVCKKKHLTNIRSSAADDAIRLAPPVLFSLEQAMEYIEEDELVEVTPGAIRMRKKILDRNLRIRSSKRKV
jgi:GTP-binding protein